MSCSKRKHTVENFIITDVFAIELCRVTDSLAVCLFRCQLNKSIRFTQWTVYVYIFARLIDFTREMLLIKDLSLISVPEQWRHQFKSCLLTGALTTANCVSVKLSARGQSAMTVISLATLVLISIAGVIHISQGNTLLLKLNISGLLSWNL